MKQYSSRYAPLKSARPSRFVSCMSIHLIFMPAVPFLSFAFLSFTSQGSFRGALSPAPQKASATSPRKRGAENAVVHFFRTIVSNAQNESQDLRADVSKCFSSVASVSFCVFFPIMLHVCVFATSMLSDLSVTLSNLFTFC